MVWAFFPIAALLTVTPGAATAMVIRSAMSGLSLLVSHAKRAFDESQMARWLERVSGSVLIGLGIRVAVESR